LISDLSMPVPSENRQSLRVQRRRLEAALREATSDNEKGGGFECGYEKKNRAHEALNGRTSGLSAEVK
jgi:hypothetical protein